MSEALRELIASKRRWAENIAKVCMAESNQFRAGDIIAFCALEQAAQACVYPLDVTRIRALSSEPAVQVEGAGKEKTNVPTS